MNAFARTLLTSIVILAGAGTASGQMTYLTQTRSVYAATNAGSQTFSNSTVGPWSAGASSSYPMGSASASAGQTSDLRPDAITFVGGSGASNQNAFLATCRAILDVTFSISEPAAFELVRTGDNYGYAGVRVTSGTTTVFTSSLTNLPASTAGTLAPGTYRFEVSLYSDAPWSGPDYIYNNTASFSFNVPAPGACAFLGLVGGATCVRRRRR